MTGKPQLSEDMRSSLEHWKRVIFRRVSGRSVSQDVWDRATRLQAEFDGLLSDQNTTDELATEAIERLRSLIAEGGLG